ncbi:MAG: hypothetical protein MHM6MM_004151 [Cercozoa sp. M6MM]
MRKGPREISLVLGHVIRQSSRLPGTGLPEEHSVSGLTEDLPQKFARFLLQTQEGRAVAQAEIELQKVVSSRGVLRRTGDLPIPLRGSASFDQLRGHLLLFVASVSELHGDERTPLALVDFTPTASVAPSGVSAKSRPPLSLKLPPHTSIGSARLPSLPSVQIHSSVLPDKLDAWSARIGRLSRLVNRLPEVRETSVPPTPCSGIPHDLVSAVGPLSVPPSEAGTLLDRHTISMGALANNIDIDLPSREDAEAVHRQIMAQLAAAKELDKPEPVDMCSAAPSSVAHKAPSLPSMGALDRAKMLLAAYDDCQPMENRSATKHSSSSSTGGTGIDDSSSGRPDKSVLGEENTQPVASSLLAAVSELDHMVTPHVPPETPVAHRMWKQAEQAKKERQALEKETQEKKASNCKLQDQELGRDITKQTVLLFKKVSKPQLQDTAAGAVEKEAAAVSPTTDEDDKSKHDSKEGSSSSRSSSRKRRKKHSKSSSRKKRSEKRKSKSSRSRSRRKHGSRSHSRKKSSRHRRSSRRSSRSSRSSRRSGRRHRSSHRRHRRRHSSGDYVDKQINTSPRPSATVSTSLLAPPLNSAVDRLEHIADRIERAETKGEKDQKQILKLQQRHQLQLRLTPPAPLKLQMRSQEKSSPKHSPSKELLNERSNETQVSPEKNAAATETEYNFDAATAVAPKSSNPFTYDNNPNLSAALEHVRGLLQTTSLTTEGLLGGVNHVPPSYPASPGDVPVYPAIKSAVLMDPTQAYSPSPMGDEDDYADFTATTPLPPRTADWSGVFSSAVQKPDIDIANLSLSSQRPPAAMHPTVRTGGGYGYMY